MSQLQWDVHITLQVDTSYLHLFWPQTRSLATGAFLKNIPTRNDEGNENVSQDPDDEIRQRLKELRSDGILNWHVLCVCVCVCVCVLEKFFKSKELILL